MTFPLTKLLARYTLYEKVSGARFVAGAGANVKNPWTVADSNGTGLGLGIFA